MKTINANTKISVLLKENSAALDAIISISSKFNKLKNPLLRKLMAPRTSIQMASKVGGCTVQDFFDKLEPLGFIIDREAKTEEQNGQNKIPEFVKKMTKENTVELDVRTMLATGGDPLKLILKTLKEMDSTKVLNLINSFEPVPLILLLEKQGFESYSETINDDLVYTYFNHKDGNAIKEVDTRKAAEGWDEIYELYKGKIETVDVRHLEMPMPMMTILEALDNMSDDKALYVIHKRIPVFLLPELTERKLDYRIKDVSDGEVYLLIFKN